MVSSTPAIEIDGLTRRFGDVLAVDALSLTVDEGEVFGFLGPNGAGKSTTIHMLLGFLEPTAGSAHLLGHSVTDDSRAIRERIGILPEGYGTYENLTGREHVVSAIETKGAADDPDAILERVGLDPSASNRAVGGYSKGMAQRLGLAVALVGDPALLILDEPTSGLDPTGVKRLRAIIDAELDRGTTVFFSSHILDEVERVCDRVAILHDGSLQTVDSVDDLRASLSIESTIEVTLKDEPTGVDIGDMDGVADYEIDSTSVRVRCTKPPAKMQILRRLDDAATVLDIDIENGSLETIFEAYTSASDGSPPAGNGSTPPQTELEP